MPAIKEDILSLKTPPHSIEAEMMVLGSMLIDKEAIEKAIGIIQQDSFYKESHQKIFSTILELYNKDIPIDIYTVSEKLKDFNLLEEIGGIEYLTNLVDFVTSAANVDFYLKVVKQKYILRQLITNSNKIINMCYDANQDTELLLDKAETIIFNIAKEGVSHDFISIQEMIPDALQKIEEFYQQKKHITGVPTGFSRFDELTAGLQKSNLIIIAGRPTHGKTAIVLNIAEHSSLIHNIPVGIFSLEMSRDELLLRFLCSLARTDIRKVRSGYLERKYWTNLTTAAEKISKSPIYIDDTSNLTVLEIRARARRLSAELRSKDKNLGLIIIDYLQLIKSSEKYDSRQAEIAEISRALKAMARDLNIPVVAVSQLSRRPEEKGRDGIPRLSDLRESGALEQDADVVAFIYREELYRPHIDELKGKAKFIIAKQRNGPIGEVNLVFHSEFTKFEDAMPEFQTPPEAR